MNLRISTLVMKYISILFVFLTPQMTVAGWVVDFKNKKSGQLSPMVSESPEPSLNLSESSREPSSVKGESQDAATDKGLFEKIFSPSQATQDVVILNTDQGFLPNTVRVKEGSQYRLIVVNVNEKARNVSFILDSFSEHHATFYGQVKSFHINPKKEGVYTFVSPETGAQGRLVVHPAVSSPSMMTPTVRTPASE